jgi:DNA polymerase III epsilon subunit-like protein
VSVLFLDIEATSLSNTSYPIELGWTDLVGAGEAYLIRRHASWGDDWDPRAQAVHGITREQLEAEGLPVEKVVARFLAAAEGKTVITDAPAFDAAWLNEALMACGHPVGMVRLNGLRDELIAAILPDCVAFHGAAAADDWAAEIVDGRLRRRERRGNRAHRALADAQENRRLWLSAVARASMP